MSRTSLYFFAIVFCLATESFAAEQPAHSFRQLVLTEEFHGEGATVADIDGDGKQDIVSGPYWYAGPDFRVRHAYAKATPLSIKGYSNYFFLFTHDFNDDERLDILAIGMPGQPAHWFQNPGTSNSTWIKHLAFPNVGNESPHFADITGDESPELVCIADGVYGYASPNPQDPTAVWSFTPLTTKQNYGYFTHGLGLGDVNSDGRIDLLETNGWWEQTSKNNALFKFHAQKFAASGGAQMFAVDVDKDGDRDVVSVQNAHAFGLTWFEQRGTGDGVVFVPHTITTNDPQTSAGGVSLSQMHSLAVVDIDGDGRDDLVTGKRFYAHGGADPGSQQLPTLYWFRNTPTTSGVDFVPHLISARAGVGTQLTIADVNDDKRLDIVVGNKLGTYVFLHETTADDPEAPPTLTKSQRRIGTKAFANVVRETGPLTPQQERETFVLPSGFDVQLVASEPDIAKPLNIAFDARGRLWVSSSVEYPFPAKEGEGRDTIKILEDTTGDGYADQVTTFADNLNIPIGLYPYRDGVICYSIPNIWFLRDTTGDDKADVRERLYGPMGFERDTHGMCNAFRRGADGWLYACHGFNNETEVAGRDGHSIKMQSGNTFRMRVDGSRIEHYTHGQVNPFGMDVDVWGDRFTADCHTKPLTLLLKDGYYESFGKPHDGLGFVPAVMEHLHGSTAIGGVALYHARDFPGVFQGNSFHGNVMTSRINRNSIQRIGSTVVAHEEPDLLLSGDPWFRPSDLIVGPDGALYITDFYNKIIGHYEVKLDDPRRDRTRGRIWRISYQRTDDRRDDSNVQSTSMLNLDDVDSQFAAISSTNQTVRELARETILLNDDVDTITSKARAILIDADAPVDARVQAMWILFRVGRFTAELADVVAATNHTMLRVHLMRVVGVMNVEGDRWPVKLILDGLEDESPMVRRAAATAAAEYAAQIPTKTLLETIQETPTTDKHLRHALRMALRNRLGEPAAFKPLDSSSDPEFVADEADVLTVASVALAIKSEDAGAYVARHIESLAKRPLPEFVDYVTFAARFVHAADVVKLTATAREKFAGDRDLQLKLLRALDSGLQQRGGTRPDVVRQWAIDLARDLLGIDTDGNVSTSQPIEWSYVPHRGTKNLGNPWVLSRRRKSADGREQTPLWSSFPRGERWTGVARSDTFTLDKSFSFYLAGHDGYPDKPLGRKNVVRVRDAASGRVVKEWSPPRNDVAQLQSWATSEYAGHDVRIELVDGDDAGAFAWLAVGRFSNSRLNPTQSSAARASGLKLTADFRLTELQRPLIRMLPQTKARSLARSRVAEAIVRIEPTAVKLALAEGMSVGGLSRDVEASLMKAICGEDADDVTKLLGEVLKVASAAEQLRIAKHLASDEMGVGVLLSNLEAGRASLRLLTDASIKQQLAARASKEIERRTKALIEQLPNEDDRVQTLIDSRIAAVQRSRGSVEVGAKIFAKNCAACHQVAGKGKQVGPNLDGIGNRGLSRLCEDILSPSRNVDVAFMSTAIITTEGRVLSGLVKRTEGNRIVLIDRKGEEITIDKNDVDEQVKSRISPMPSNVDDTLNEEQFADLLAYLLSLRS